MCAYANFQLGHRSSVRTVVRFFVTVFDSSLCRPFFVVIIVRCLISSTSLEDYNIYLLYCSVFVRPQSYLYHLTCTPLHRQILQLIHFPPGTTHIMQLFLLPFFLIFYAHFINRRTLFTCTVICLFVCMIQLRVNECERTFFTLHGFIQQIEIIYTRNNKKEKQKNLNK